MTNSKICNVDFTQEQKDKLICELKDKLYDIRCEYVRKNTQVEELMNEIKQLALEAQKIDCQIAGILDSEENEKGGDDDGPEAA